MSPTYLSILKPLLLIVLLVIEYLLAILYLSKNGGGVPKLESLLWYAFVKRAVQNNCGFPFELWVFFLVLFKIIVVPFELWVFFLETSLCIILFDYRSTRIGLHFPSSLEFGVGLDQREVPYPRVESGGSFGKGVADSGEFLFLRIELEVQYSSAFKMVVIRNKITRKYKLI